MKWPWTKKEPKLAPKFCELDGCPLVPIDWHLSTYFDEQTGQGKEKYVDGLVCSKSLKTEKSRKYYNHRYHTKWPPFNGWAEHPNNKFLIQLKNVEANCAPEENVDDE